MSAQKVKILLKYLFRATFISFLLTLIASSFSAHAQGSNLGIATTYTVSDEDYQDGDIVSFTDKTGNLALSRKSNDEKIFGVVVLNPQIVYRTSASGPPIIRGGDVFVNVTTLNGSIGIGDLVTSSTFPGKGQKSTGNAGYVLGVALASFSEEDGAKVVFEGQEISVGKVKVALGIKPASSSSLGTRGGIVGLLDQLGVSILRTVQKPEGTALFMRYLIAGLVSIMVIFFAFNNFGHNITKGIESIGRNPLAKIQIQSMIVLNIILIAVVAIGGIILSLIMIRY